jgi:hypothetical protein
MMTGTANKASDGYGPNEVAQRRSFSRSFFLPSQAVIGRVAWDNKPSMMK